MGELTVAMKTAKTINQELVVAENRVEFLKAEEIRLKKSNEATRDEIDKKSQDYSIYMGQKDAETKQLRANLLVEREQFSKEKADFMGILQDHQKEKAALASEKHAFESEKSKHTGQVENVQQFVIAIRRAVSLLGI